MCDNKSTSELLVYCTKHIIIITSIRPIYPFLMDSNKILANCARCIKKCTGWGIGYIYMIRRPYVIVFYFRTISICEEKLWKDLHCKSWYQCIMNRKVSMYWETSWFAWAIPWHNFTHRSNLGSFFFLFHSLTATSSKIYQMMALLIKHIVCQKKNNNNFPWKREGRDPFWLKICSSKISYPLGIAYRGET